MISSVLGADVDIASEPVVVSDALPQTVESTKSIEELLAELQSALSA